MKREVREEVSEEVKSGTSYKGEMTGAGLIWTEVGSSEEDILFKR